MGQLVLLLVAAAWAAVLIPPLLRARIENRPNNSVSDFRNQLSSLQKTVPDGAVQMRPMGRPLVGSPFERPAAAGRPGGPGAPGEPTLKSISINRPAPPPRNRAADHAGHRERRGPRDVGEQQRRRRTALPGDPYLAQQPAQHQQQRIERDPRREAAPRRPQRPSPEPEARGRRQHGDRAARDLNGRDAQQRRRSNVMFLLVLLTGCSLFLAVTTDVTATVYLFALSFLALGGYIYLLGQARQAERSARRVQRSQRTQRAPRQRAPQHQRAPRRQPIPGERYLDIA